MAPFPTGTVTFLFTDIEGSTRLLQQLGDAYAVALAEHQALLRAAFAAYEGAEVDTQGDAFFVAFATAPEALPPPLTPTPLLGRAELPEGAGTTGPGCGWRGAMVRTYLPAPQPGAHQTLTSPRHHSHTTTKTQAAKEGPTSSRSICVSNSSP